MFFELVRIKSPFSKSRNPKTSHVCKHLIFKTFISHEPKRPFSKIIRRFIRVKRRFISPKRRFVRMDRRFDLCVSPLHFCEAGLPTAKSAKTQQKRRKASLNRSYTERNLLPLRAVKRRDYDISCNFEYRRRVVDWSSGQYQCCRNGKDVEL